MFNNSDHEEQSTLSKEDIKIVLDKIESDLEDAREHLKCGGNGWYSLDRIMSIGITADLALRGKTPQD